MSPLKTKAQTRFFCIYKTLVNQPHPISKSKFPHPQEWLLLRLCTRPRQHNNSARAIAEDQLSATLPIIESLEPNQKVTPYKIQIKAVTTGVHKLNVAVSATGLVAPITASDSTRILAPN